MFPNARGDELGSGGQIIPKREEIVKEYYDNSNGVKTQKQFLEMNSHACRSS